MPLALFAIGVFVALVAWVGIGLDRPLVCLGTAALCGALAFGILSSDQATLMNTSKGAQIFSIVLVVLPVAGTVLARLYVRTLARLLRGRPHA